MIFWSANNTTENFYESTLKYRDELIIIMPIHVEPFEWNGHK